MEREAKTIEEWFWDLNNSVRVKAIKNTVIKGRLKEDRFSLRDAIGAAFTWEDTPEGYSYWYNLRDRIERNLGQNNYQ